jgi:hypothetical protein
MCEEAARVLEKSDDQANGCFAELSRRTIPLSKVIEHERRVPQRNEVLTREITAFHARKRAQKLHEPEALQRVDDGAQGLLNRIAKEGVAVQHPYGRGIGLPHNTWRKIVPAFVLELSIGARGVEMPFAILFEARWRLEHHANRGVT